MFKRDRLRKIIGDLSKMRLRKLTSVENIIYKQGDYKRPLDVDESEIPFENFKEGEFWGGNDLRYWFRAEIIITEEMKDETVIMKLETGKEGEWDALNPQFLLFIDDEIRQGLDVNHTEVKLCEKAKVGDTYKIDLHAFAGMQALPVKFKLSIAALDQATEMMMYDLKVPYEVTEHLSEDSIEYVKTIKCLIDAINILDLKKNYHNGEYYESIFDARNYLKTHLYDNKDLVDVLKKNKLLPTVSCVGHSHIDVAWLWTLKQTREKVVRSFSTVLSLMDEYDEYKFMASQPILLQYIKEDYPELFERIKEKIKEGRFEVEGGMWLEADCNLSSGESLIRHILYGKKYMKDEFDVESEILWLPDVFGYSAALPQILKSFGINTFVTTKISWNEYNKMPYDTFNWRGMDGSDILTYFITMMDYDNYKKGSFKTVYEGEIKPAQIHGAWARYQQKDINDNILISYGHGDGGGGPTKKMLENARRMNDYIPGLPHVELTTLKEYFDGLKERLPDKLNTWDGELYLEYHRGTLTTMGKNKWYNRKCEFLYQNLEFLSVLAEKYDKKLIRDGWDVILLNQFHDIIPGTSIEEVYVESHEQYEKIYRDGLKLQSELVDRISDKLKGELNIKSKSLLVINPLSIGGDKIISFEYDKDLVLFDGKNEVKVQRNNNVNTFIANDIPSMGYKLFTIKEVSKEKHISTKKRLFETDYYEIEFNDEGMISSLYDKIENRQVVKENEVLNSFIVYEDRPHNWDAWDVNIYYEEKATLINNLESFEVIEDGEVYSRINTVRRFQNSIIEQDITIYKNSRRIDFNTNVDWHEKHLLLKVSFPLDIKSTTATYDIQFGNVERPTHRNTSWDEAKFEVCGHKWADVSERGYGVSLLNDSKYGYDIYDQTMRLSLLRGSDYPNPNADQGKHTFKYALLPHKGTWHEDTYKEAYNFNVDMLTKVIDGSDNIEAKSSLSSYFSVDKENVIIETIKPAESGVGIILRLYETCNTREEVQLNINIPFNTIKEVNLKEEVIHVLESNKFVIKPYEIKTFLVI